MPRLIVRSSAEDRLASALDWLRAEQERPELLVLTANRGAADDLLRRAAVERGHLFAVHRATLRQAAFELASLPLADASAAPLTRLGAIALTTRAVDAARSSAALDYFAPVVDMPGFPLALDRTVAELRLHGLTPARLEDGDRASRDLATLLQRFEGELERFALVDLAGVFAAAIRRIEDGGHRYVGLPLLVLDMVPETRAEASLLGALSRRAPACLALMPPGDGAAIGRMEEALSVAAEGTSNGSSNGGASSAGSASAGSASGDGAPASALARSRRYLFAPETPPSARDGSVDDVELFSAPGEDRECVEIVRRIHARAEQDVPFDEMAILLRQPFAYLPLLEDALRRGGVPAFFSRGTSRPDPAGRAFLALLACAAEGLSASRFSEYLSLGEAPAPDPSGAPPPVVEVPWVEPASDDQLVFKSLEPARDAAPPAPPGPTLPTPAAWERLLVDAAVIGGRDRWRRRLAGLREEFNLRLRHTASEEVTESEYLRRQIDRLDNLARFALPIVDALGALPKAAPWGEWLTLLERLAVLVLRDPERVQRLLAELRPMADVGPVTLEQVYSLLAERLSFLYTEPPLRRYGRVFIGTLPDALGRSFDTVFLPGLSEGLFPRKPFEDPLLLDAARRRLDAALLVQDDRFAAERALLRLALGAARERLVASYPRIDQRLGRARVPSFYALDLLRAAYGELPDLHSLERTQGQAAPGWPAPADPDAAIDDCEFDLAMLAPLLAPSALDVRGKARYLMHGNPHLARSLRARWARWRPSWTKDDGLVLGTGSTAALELLAGELPVARSYSPTALQTYAACPYRFVLHAIHRLRPREDRTSPEQLDPLTRGSLFHETQFAFFGEVRARSLLPLHRDFEGQLLDIADDALAKVAGQYEEDLAPAIPRIWKSEIESLRIDLRGWIRKLLEEDGGFAPSHFEFAFGLDPSDPGKRDPASTSQPAVVLGGRKLRGSIDLVERDWRRRALRVTDHKTGRAPSEKGIVIGGGELLQPVLYALAAEAIVAGEGERVDSGRLFYCTQRGGYLEIDVPLDDRSRGAAQQVLGAVEDAVTRGFLPAAPREGACDWCDYRAVCGPYEELRVGKKKQAELAALIELRRQS
ncbi:MAG TPA: PD-(D/E)XK nuclease family protein [Thermoanaerobaculia bacterium]|nr:PD-(D/E)XK nuclease family protein [Thermoanaerobaculia bacterium]